MVWGAYLYGGHTIAMFLQRPCEKREELFDRDEELEITLKCIRNGVWVAILGPRMSGKTSIAKVAGNMLSREGYNCIYVNLIRAYGVRIAVERILASLPKSIIDKVKDLLEFIGLKAGVTGIEIKLRQGVSYTSILEKLFQEISKRDKLVVVLDEVQEIKGGVNHFLAMLYRLRTSTKNLIFIFTGSAIGLMKTLLYPSPRNPMYGRTPVKVELKPWSIKLALEFLEQGLGECNVEYTERELEEAIRELGTLPGWLSFYGLRRCAGKPHRQALNEALNQATIIARSELEEILKGRARWARKAIRMLAYGARWSELLREAKTSPNSLKNLLETLKNLYLLAEESGVYRITDPVYKRAALKL